MYPMSIQNEATSSPSSRLPIISLPSTDNLTAGPDHPGTVLLVEDEEGIRDIATLLLETIGYCVVSAASGNEAVEKFLDFKGTVDVLLTDVLLPGMDGGQLATLLTGIDPDLKVVYMSGYSADALPGDGAAYFVQKPFTREILACKLREVLQGPPSAFQQ